MADSAKPGKRSPLRPPDRSDYEVGYRKPPQHTRFKPGASGNPRGRPKGRRNRLPALHEERMKQIILEEAYRTIRVNDGRRQVTIPMAKAIIRAMALSAAKGQSRAQRLFSELLAGTERSHKALHDEYLSKAIDYKFEWELELERRRDLGIAAPDPIPHPDHIEIDMRTGTVIVKGPMTKEEKKKWDQLRERKADCDEAIAAYEAQLKDDAFAPYRKFILEEIEHERKLRAMIARVIKD